jgi:hypothetical protein
MRARVVGAVVVLGVLASSARAEHKDTAELFPAGTLAYLEFRQPDKLSRELATLFKGSALEDMPALMAKFREKRGDQRNWWFEDYTVGTIGLFAGPEVIAEFARLGGGAIAFTGFNKNQEPEIVGIILSGDSNGPTFVMRAFLTMQDSVRKVGVCEGVNLYQEKRIDYSKPIRKGDPPPVADWRGPVYALMKDGLVIGSSADGVKDVIRRLKSKTADPSLASVKAFREAAKVRDKGGLFGYADMGAMMSHIDEAMKKAGPAANIQWGWFKTLVNPKVGRIATLSVTLDKSNFELEAKVNLDPKESCQLLDALPDKAAKADLLHFVPKDAAATLGLALPDGDKRFAKVLGLLDALEKANGRRDRDLPGRKVADIEEKLKLQIGKDVFGKITGVVLALEPVTVSKGGTPIPLLVLGATDVNAAKALEEEILPKLTGILGEQVKARQETIGGQKITTLPVPLLDPDLPICYGRQGKTLVLGMDGKRVALALTEGAKKGGLLGEAKVAAALKELKEPVVLGVFSAGNSLPLLLPDVANMGPRVIRKGEKEQPPQREKRPAELDPVVAKLSKDLAKATESLPPGILTLERKPDQVTLRLRQPGLKSVTAKIVTLYIESTLERISKARQGQGPGGIDFPKEIELPPPPCPPVKN